MLDVSVKYMVEAILQFQNNAIRIYHNESNFKRSKNIVEVTLNYEGDI